MNDSNRQLRCGAALLGLLLFCGAHYAAAGAPPMVSKVRAAQRSGTKLVDIYYDLADSDSATLAVSVAVSTNGGASYTLPATSFSGSGWGGAVTPGLSKQITWNAGADWSGHYSANVRFRVTADDAAAPSGMSLIPAGSFTMGDSLDGDELPLHTVYVSAFYMDKYPVTKSLWDTVYQWATNHGYSFDNSGSSYNGVSYSKGPNHPVHMVNWYDCVKWCNARSQKEGLTPAYYTDSGLTVVYKSGQVAPYVKWAASGYRLPTEAEWEKAARGGASGHRFPWSDADTITWSRANYYAVPLSAGGYAYDVNPTSGFNPAWTSGGSPYTTPVGSFAANGYGLYDMAGNVSQWCWDWFDFPYSSGSQTDPRGPTSGSYRVYRGGSWGGPAVVCRAARRDYGVPTTNDNCNYGFRSVLPSGQ